jgi:hypothetical protein
LHTLAKRLHFEIATPKETIHESDFYVINTLIKPAAVIASHANEVATKEGKIIAGTRTASFSKATRVPVHAPLSGRIMEFNAKGKCVAGC